MGLNIVPHDGDILFSVHESIGDTVILVDATRDELIDWYAERAAKQAREEMERRLKMLDNGQRFRFSDMTLKEMLESHRPEHCQDEEWNKLIADKLSRL